MGRTVSEFSKAFIVKRVLNYMDNNPRKNIPRILDWLQKHDKGGTITNQVGAIRNAINDPDNNWSKLITSLWEDIDQGVRRTLFENLVINASMIGAPRQLKAIEVNDCNIPWAILMDPTSACNLHCIGCWAAEYGNKLNLSLEELDSVIQQGKAMGTYFYIYSGGEPLVRKNDIITLCE